VDAATFAAVQPLLGSINELADKQIAFEELRRLMADLANVVGKLPNSSYNEHSFFSKVFRGSTYD
jgi:hypothetical protein